MSIFDSAARSAWLMFMATISDRLTDGPRPYDRLSDDELEQMEYYDNFQIRNLLYADD